MATLTLETSRRAFCAGSVALAVSPCLTFLGTPAAADPIVHAVSEYFRLEPVLEAIWRRRDDTFDAAEKLLGECPMHGDVEATIAIMTRGMRLSAANWSGSGNALLASVTVM